MEPEPAITNTTVCSITVQGASVAGAIISVRQPEALGFAGKQMLPRTYFSRRSSRWLGPVPLLLPHFHV